MKTLNENSTIKDLIQSIDNEIESKINKARKEKYIYDKSNLMKEVNELRSLNIEILLFIHKP